MARRVKERRATVDVARQTLTVCEDGRTVFVCPVSTAKNGVGAAEGSGCTPPGRHRIARLFRRYLRGKRAGQNPVVAVPLRIRRKFANYRVVPLAEVGLLARGDVREFYLLADLQNLLPGLVALVHLLCLVVLHQRLEVFLLQGLEIHGLRNFLDGLVRKVESPANYIQAVRGTAESGFCRKETVGKHGAHFLLLFEIILHELAEIVVVE